MSTENKYSNVNTTWKLLLPGLVFSLLLGACSDSSDSRSAPEIEPPPPPPAPAPLEDRAYYILPPGNYGGLPTSENSLDQLALYDGLTPLRDNVTDADIERFYLPENFQPIGETVEEVTGRQGTTILYDEFGIPHISGDTRADLAFGAGWVTARDRSLLVSLGRGPARVAVADIPGINAFSLVTSGQSFVPSAATEQLVSDQVDLIIETYGDEGREIIADSQAYADGYNAYVDTQGANPQPYTVNDVIATTAFIGSIFGAGGGNEVVNAELLSTLIADLGEGQGQLAWADAMLSNDPEAPTTINERFEYGVFTGGDVVGSVVIDKDSVISLDPRDNSATPNSEDDLQGVIIPSAGRLPDREASNFLIVDTPATDNATRFAVMGPQLGYYYPEIVQQIHFSGAGIEAQGVGVPGLSMYLLIGRTEDYAWSFTSAGHDIRDVFAEILCNLDDSPPTRESTHYEFNGECIAFDIFDAGTLNGIPLVYPVSVHGPMIGTATSNGQPIALTRKRSTFGRDGLNLVALKNMTEGEASTPEKFWQVANKFGFTFNWGYISHDSISYFSSGYLPVRAEGLDRRLPTLGSGEYEWQGFLTQDQHPHAVQAPSDRLLNWNNKSAPGFMHGDSIDHGSVHRVENFDQFPEKVSLAGVVGVMNRAATEDLSAQVWPVISEVLRGGEAPSTLSGQVADILDAWVANDAPRLDADDDGFYDDAGPTIMDALSDPMVAAVMRPVFGDTIDSINDGINDVRGASYVDKDLRTLLGKDVIGKFNLSYCGAGELDDCRDSLWEIIEIVSAELASERGDDPTTWLREGARTGFVPGLIADTFRFTSRPTFQQVLQFVPATPQDE